MMSPYYPPPVLWICALCAENNSLVGACKLCGLFPYEAQKMSIAAEEMPDQQEDLEFALHDEGGEA